MVHVGSCSSSEELASSSGAGLDRILGIGLGLAGVVGIVAAAFVAGLGFEYIGNSVDIVVWDDPDGDVNSGDGTKVSFGLRLGRRSYLKGNCVFLLPGVVELSTLDLAAAGPVVQSIGSGVWSFVSRW